MKCTFLALLLSLSLWASPPDCQVSYLFANTPGSQTDGVTTFIATGVTPLNPNNSGCNAWAVLINVSGFSATSVVFQSANAGGTRSTFLGTTVSGSNPSTTTTSSTFLASGYYPYTAISVGTMTGTGSIKITIYGWLSPAYLGAAATGGGPAGDSTDDAQCWASPTTFGVCSEIALAGTNAYINFPSNPTHTPAAGDFWNDAGTFKFGNAPLNVVSSSGTPGVGLCHFAGSTQNCTSSLVVAADISGGTLCATTITTGTSATLSTCFTVNQHATAGTAVAYTLPTAASGLQYCIDNSWNGSAANTGVLTFATSAAGQFMVFTDGTLTATGGNVTSGGAARDGACVYGIDSTHWMFLPHAGVWTKH